jgi:hypothetical protein
MEPCHPHHRGHPGYLPKIERKSLHNTGTPCCCCEDHIRKANIKLYELEQLLLPFTNSHHIEKLIGSIVRHCNKFGDYNYVDECFENHRTNILEKRWHWYSK